VRLEAGVYHLNDTGPAFGQFAPMIVLNNVKNVSLVGQKGETMTAGAGSGPGSGSRPGAGPGNGYGGNGNGALIGEGETASESSKYSQRRIDPTATTLLVHGLRGGFSLNDAVDIKLSGFQMDMARMPYTYGHCTAATPSSMTVQFDAALYPFDASTVAQNPWLLKVIDSPQPALYAPVFPVMDVPNTEQQTVDQAMCM
jgi:hypothetical protein